MSESEFWRELRVRIVESGVLSALGYCDWIEVKRYVLPASGARIDGLMGFVNGSRSDSHRFTLLLPADVGSIDEIDWRALLPNPEKGSGWLRVKDGLITIDSVEGN
jgi:hypothetical protein